MNTIATPPAAPFKRAAIARLSNLLLLVELLAGDQADTFPVPSRVLLHAAMEIASNIAVPLVVSLIGWFAVVLTGRPIRDFLDVRREVRRKMLLYANVPARFKEVPGDPSKREVLEISDADAAKLNEAKAAFRDLATQLLAFVDTERLAVRILGLFRFDALRAGGDLMGLSNSFDAYGNTKHLHVTSIEQSLRIRRR